MQIIFMILFILIGFSAPILLTALLVYLLFWLMETAHTVLLGLLDGTLAELCRRKKKRLIVGGTVFLLTVLAFLCLEFWFPPTLNLDWKEVPCSEAEILAEVPDIVLTEKDIALLDAVLAAPEAVKGLELNQSVTFSPAVAARYTAEYGGKPSEECEIEIRNNRLFTWETIHWNGNPQKELYLSRFLYEDKPDEIFKSIRFYREGSKKEFEKILCEYNNKNGVLTKKILTHDWFAWVDRYTIMFTG